MEDFYFALTNIEAVPLLKEEIKLFYKDFKLSYSKKEFLTFKGPKGARFSPIMAKLSGRTIGKNLKDDSKLNLVFSENESWLLDAKKESELILKEIEPPKEAPSRAYSKIAEATRFFNLPFKEGNTVLELGSAPGGASYFLLEQGLKVIGVDPALMDITILNNVNFTHLKLPFERLTQKDIPHNIDYLLSDINLPPTVVTKEIERLLHFINPKIIVITLKLNDERYLKNLFPIKQNFKDLGFSNLHFKYLPSHRKEVALVGLR